MALSEPVSSEKPARLPSWLRYTVLAALIALVALFAWLTWNNGSGLIPSAFSRSMPLKNPVALAWDGKDHLYALDDRYYRIIELTAAGEVVRHIDSRAVDPRHFEYFEALTVDDQGALYAAKVVYFVDTEIIDYEQICCYPPEGDERVLYTLRHDGDDAAFDARIVTLQVASGWIHFDVRSTDTIELWRAPRSHPPLPPSRPSSLPTGSPLRRTAASSSPTSSTSACIASTGTGSCGCT